MCDLHVGGCTAPNYPFRPPHLPHLESERTEVRSVLEICLPIWQSPFICMSAYLSVRLSVSRSLYLSFSLSFFLSFFLSFCLSLSLPLSLSLFISLSLSLVGDFQWSTGSACLWKGKYATFLLRVSMLASRTFCRTYIVL